MISYTELDHLWHCTQSQTTYGIVHRAGPRLLFALFHLLVFPVISSRHKFVQTSLHVIVDTTMVYLFQS